jgi:hypothetical protein
MERMNNNECICSSTIDDLTLLAVKAEKIEKEKNYRGLYQVSARLDCPGCPWTKGGSQINKNVIKHIIPASQNVWSTIL